MKRALAKLIVFYRLCVALCFSPPYCINLKCRVKEPRRDEFLTLIRENQNKTLANEPESLQYVVGEDVNTRNVFYIHEQFQSPEAFSFHRNTPHNDNWQLFKASEPFEEDPITNFYHGTHAPFCVPIRDAFCLNVQLDVKAELREEFLRVIQNNAINSNKEQLCLQYIYGEDENVANRFHFHEQYKGKDGGREGFDAHTTMEHFKLWEEFTQLDPFTQPPIVDFFRSL